MGAQRTGGTNGKDQKTINGQQLLQKIALKRPAGLKKLLRTSLESNEKRRAPQNGA